MKVILATITISCALPALDFTSVHAQARGGGSVSGSAGAGLATGSPGSVSGTPGTTVTRPTGNLAGQPGIQPGTALSTPAGAQTAIAPNAGTVVPGVINPGGISATPPGTVGRTFERTTIGGPLTETTVTPGAIQPAFRFPPASSTPQSILTNTGVGSSLNPGILDSTTFPPRTPVGVQNRVGANFGSGVPNTVPREAVAVNLPPGARVVTNFSGVPEAVVPPPAIISTNSVGRGPAFESSSSRAVEVPQRSAPPRNPPIR